MALDDSALLRLLHSTENSFVERKTVGDQKDWIKTVVAFANTLANDQEGVLFIGATDKGQIEETTSGLDNLQKTLSEKLKSVYPNVYYTTRTVLESGRECLAVIVPGSPLKPHFAGQLFLRDGSKTVVAAAEKYETLLAARLGKTFEIQKWQGKTITLRILSRQNGMAYMVNQYTHVAQVVNVNQFYATVSFNNQSRSYPLSRVEISYDNQAGRPELAIEDFPSPY
jgi:predicted HTH transcriptional regulator